MKAELKTKVESMIEDAIGNELQYQKDYITNVGWSFLEDNAAKLILNKIENDYDDEEELENLTLNDIESYLTEVICEYEENNPPIRMHSLW